VSRATERPPRLFSAEKRTSAAAIGGFLLLPVVLASGLAACSVDAPSAARTPAPVSSLGPGAAATSLPATSFGPPPSATPNDGNAPLTIDPSLLAMLPADLDGVPLTESLDYAAEALQNASLPAIASGIDVAVAVDTSTGDLVYALVVRLRPGALDEAGYRQWRDSFNDGACSAVVTGNAETTINGRTVFVGTCAADLRTYHVWLEDQDILVSASSLGERNLGEVLVGRLRPAA
jgi:hypothetical protein